MSRAAIYARYSSDLQSASSIDDQVRLCRERIDEDGHTLIDVFSDYAISGGSLKARAGMQALLAEAQAGRFDVVYAEALDRVSRDQEDIAAIYKRLAHADVQLITLAEGEISELHIGLKGTMNALFLKDLAQKTKRGQRGRVEAGKIAGGNSYGYRVVHKLLADGTPVTGEREIDPAEAAIVRRIFEEYASGLTPRRIVSALNAERVPGPRGGAWNASTINGSRQRRNGILNNELYLGRVVWNRQRFLKDPETGKRVSRPNPESAWITAEVPELRIIGDDLWDKVQTLKARYASRSGNKRQTKKRLLSGLVKCGCCGGAMTIINRERYSCSARRERGTCDSPAGIRAADLEARVLDGLREILLGNEDLVDTFAKAFQEELQRLNKTRRSQAARLTRDLAKVERGIERCLVFITEGDGDPGAVAGTLRDLEARKKVLAAELATEPSERTVEIHPNVGELYRRKVGELQTLLEDETTKTEAVDAIRSLIDRIEVRAGAKRGHPEVMLVGALASILDFACAQGGVTGDGRVLLVAGARYQRYLRHLTQAAA
ncbi:MAG: recombinase family protein [Pseudomonadota bacterium]